MSVTDTDNESSSGHSTDASQNVTDEQNGAAVRFCDPLQSVTDTENVGHGDSSGDPSRVTDAENAAGAVCLHPSTAATLWCVECDRDIAPGDPVWLRSRRRHGVRKPVCQTCQDAITAALAADEFREGDGPWIDEPCPGCGRLVHQMCERPSWSDEWYRPRYAFWCSSPCRERHWRQQNPRTRPRPSITCAVCQQSFTPTRRDAVTCSPACRQRAYRDRAQLRHASALFKRRAWRAAQIREARTLLDQFNDVNRAAVIRYLETSSNASPTNVLKWLALLADQTQEDLDSIIRFDEER